MSNEKRKMRLRFMAIAAVAVFCAAVSLLLLHALSTRARSQGPLSACKSNLKNYGTALELYSSDNGGLYPDRVQMLLPAYLKELPGCPATSKFMGVRIPVP